MAFATSAIRQESVGSMWRQTGTWTGAQGDTTGTITVRGRVAACLFMIDDSQSQEDRPVPTSMSFSGTTGLTTISVYNSSDVTAGRFFVDYR